MPLLTKLDLRLQPSPYQCSVVLDNDGSTPAQNGAVITYARQRRMPVEITELSFGSPTTPSPRTRQLAQQVMQISHEQFPTAEFVRVRPQRGLIGP
jgi:hypothetical protein